MPPVSSRTGTGATSVSSRVGSTGGSRADRDAAASRVRFRRAVSLLVMTLLLPGSAQVAVGRKDVGRLALRVWGVAVGSLVAVVALGLVWHGFAYWAASNTVVLGFVRLLLSALAVGWAVLFLDAWRLGQPLALRQKQRLAVLGLNGVMCFAVAGSLLFASHVVAVQKGFIGAMFGDGVVSSAQHGRYNVLLLGGDSGRDRTGMRPDSLTVASIDEDTGRTILFGLPRNMTGFPFAKGSVMSKAFPTTYDCATCELNSLSTWANDNRDLFRGSANPGVEATVEGVEGITGLKINYYAMVNLRGFRTMVDAVGGLRLNVRDRIPIGGVGGPVTGYIKPGVQRLNGYRTLWFARSRESADDYSRMARQKCVMNAMLQQLSPRIVVTKFEDIAKASEQLVTTDLPASQLGRFAELALKARSQPVRTVSFVPPVINTSRPDVTKVRSMVRSAVARSERPGSKAAAPAPRRPKGYTSGTQKSTVGGSIGNLRDGYAANAASNLSDAC